MKRGVFLIFLQKMRDSLRALENVRVLTVVALLTALQIVLGLLNINLLPTVRLSFGFLMVAACGMLYGPVVAGLQAMVCDLLSLFLFATGAWLPGLTLSALLGGMVYGFVLYKKPWTWQRLLLAKGIVNVFINMGLNTFWLSLASGDAMLATLWPRVVKNLVLLPVEVLMLVAMSQILRRLSARIPA